MNRRTILTASAGVFLIPSLALADVKKSKRWFIQAWTLIERDPFIIEDTKNAGRLEVTLGDKFVGCAAAFAVKNWDYYELAPISIGFMVEAPELAELRFETFGELKRLTKLGTKITEA